MDQARLALKISALFLIVVAAVTAGARRMSERLSSPAIYSIASLSPAVVVARKPTIAEIVDLVLGDRPVPSAMPQLGGKFAQGTDEARIAGVLHKYTSDTNRANRIAAALVREGRRRNIGSSLLVGVLLTENPKLNPRATSSAGARGLMQVMPFHSGKWGCASGDLFDIEANICHGVAILADNLKSSKTLPAALLGYNGCVRGTNTPDCWRYPSTVYRFARKGPAVEERFPAGTTPFSSLPTKTGASRPMKLRAVPGNTVLPKGLLVN